MTDQDPQNTVNFSLSDHEVGEAQADDIRCQVEKILESDSFAGSAQLSKFLHFVVGEFLAGRDSSLKAYTIGVEVFGRGNEFDPQSDSIVRVEASRLRQKLREYYLTAGRNDGVVIDIPKGSYRPRFTANVAEKHITKPSYLSKNFNKGFLRIPVMGIALVVIIVGVITTSFLFNRQGDQARETSLMSVEEQIVSLPDGPSIAVLPFINLSGDPSQDYFSYGISEEVITNLSRFRDLRVISGTASRPYNERALDVAETVKRYGVEYILDGSVRRTQSRVRVTAKLISSETREYLWVQEYDRELTVDDMIDLEEDIAANVVTRIAPPYAIIPSEEMKELRGQPTDNFDAYECILFAFYYWAHISPENHEKARRCLETAVQLDPYYGRAWTYLTYVYIDEDRWLLNVRHNGATSLQNAKRAAVRAAELDPTSAEAQMAVAAVSFFNGNLQRFRLHGEMAVALNPNDTELLAEFGSRLVYIGEWDRGLAMVRKAIQLNPDHPSWYNFPLVVDLYRRKKYEQALEIWNSISPLEYYPYYMFSSALLAEAGKRSEAREHARKLLELYPDFPQNAYHEFKRKNLNPELIQAFVEGLREAGLNIPPPGR